MCKYTSLLVDMFDSLKTSLIELGFDVGNEPSWEACDEDFKSLRSRLESSPTSDLIEKPFGHGPNTVLIGTVITEAISAAYWSDALLVRDIFEIENCGLTRQYSSTSLSSKRSIFIKDTQQLLPRVASRLAI